MILLLISVKPYQIIYHQNNDRKKNRLIEYINRTVQLGQNHFEGRESMIFGEMTSTEWNNLFYKHIDHHLTQFGV